MSKKPKIEIVVWLDSHSPGAQVWAQEDTIDHEPLECTSVGFVIHETAGGITLAAHRAQSEWSGVMTIPKVAIIKRRGMK